MFTACWAGFLTNSIRRQYKLKHCKFIPPWSWDILVPTNWICCKTKKMAQDLSFHCNIGSQEEINWNRCGHFYSTQFWIWPFKKWIQLYSELNRPASDGENVCSVPYWLNQHLESFLGVQVQKAWNQTKQHFQSLSFLMYH